MRFFKSPSLLLALAISSASALAAAQSPPAEPAVPTPSGFAPPGAQAMPPGAPAASPGAQIPPPGAQIPPVDGEKKPEGDNKGDPEDKVRDAVRARGGFSLGGGVLLSTTDGVIGPVMSLSGRIGVQFNHYFGLVYQNTPLITFTTQSGLDLGFIDYNTLLATLTLGHFFDVSAGPSADFYLIARCRASIGLSGPSAGCPSETSWGFGVHERISFLIGGLSGNGPRRSGFALGVDLHQAFLDGYVPMTFTVNVGAEWY